MNVAELIEVIRQEREQWVRTIQRIDPSQLTEPGVEGEWSVKDILAHVTWFDREMVQMLRTRTLAGSDWWNLPTDQRNEKIFLENRHLTLDKVAEESRQVHQELIEALRTLTDEDLNDPNRFGNMPADWQPLRILAENTYEHYQDHLAAIENWISITK